MYPASYHRAACQRKNALRILLSHLLASPSPLSLSPRIPHRTAPSSSTARPHPGSSILFLVSAADRRLSPRTLALRLADEPSAIAANVGNLSLQFIGMTPQGLRHRDRRQRRSPWKQGSSRCCCRSTATTISSPALHGAVDIQYPPSAIVICSLQHHSAGAPPRASLATIQPSHPYFSHPLARYAPPRMPSAGVPPCTIVSWL
jgi:hypothetical protein